MKNRPHEAVLGVSISSAVYARGPSRGAGTAPAFPAEKPTISKPSTVCQVDPLGLNNPCKWRLSQLDVQRLLRQRDDLGTGSIDAAKYEAGIADEPAHDFLSQNTNGSPGDAMSWVQ